MTTPAHAAFASGQGYSYYPRTMIELCSNSYLPINGIAPAVGQLGWTITWGPAELVAERESYSLAFIASRTAPGTTVTESTLVVRGTNFESVKTWLSEDFKIASTVPFASLVPTAPNAPALASGTYNGLADLLKLTDPQTRTTLAQFVSATKPPALYITGHSLGGTLAPAIFAYLHAQLVAAGATPAMGMWTFAGLTPGNRAFNAYLESLGDIPFPWRLHNTLDVAPYFWDNLKAITSLYPSADHFGWVDDLLLDRFQAIAAGHDYGQPAGDLALPGTLQAESGHFDWEKEAAYQHHPETYQELVNRMYP